MATHDYDIANQSGAAFRTDLNNALAAIQSNNSNSSSPATTVAYQWWADTSAGVLKIRNSSNNGWVELLQLDGTLTLEAGSVSAPALAFRSDLNTGIYQSNADNLNFAAGGLDRLRLGASTIFNEDGFDVDFRIESDGNANMFFVDGGNNRVGIGTSSPSRTLTVRASDCRIRLEDSDVSTSVEILNTSGDGILTTNGSTDLVFKTNNLERMRLTSGNMGVGTSSPNAKVTICETGTLTGGDINANADGLVVDNNGGNTGLTFKTPNSANSRIAFGDPEDNNVGQIAYNHSTNVMSFDAGATTIFNVTSSDFNVFGTKSGNAVSTVNLVLGIINSSGDAKKAQIESNKIADVSSTIEFHTTKSHSFDERARFDHNGHFLIGATTKVASETVGLTFDNNSFVGYLAKCSAGGSATFMDFRNSSDTALGNIKTTNGSDLQYNTSASDRSLKKNFENWTENTLELFKNINPQKFNYIQEEDTDPKHKGYVAQDLVDSFPEAYNKNDDNKYMFNPSGMVVYLMKAIQELETKVAALEAA